MVVLSMVTAMVFGKDLQNMTSMQTPASCTAFAAIHSHNDLVQLAREPAWHTTTKYVLGGGTNTLLTQSYPGLILHPTMQGITIIKQDKKHTWVKCQAATRWDDCVQFCLQHHLYGLENLSLIPGHAGAAVIQNIGAYGVELSAFLAGVDAYRLDDAEPTHFRAADCELAYRNSIFKHSLKQQFLIHAITLRCYNQPQCHYSYGQLASRLAQRGIDAPTPQEVREAVIHCRQSKLPDPTWIPNAGSFFKNPIITSSTLAQLLQAQPGMPYYTLPDARFKLPAAWLIEQCGYKQKASQGVRVHEKQALVLTNPEKASGQVIWAFAQNIIDDVKQRFGILLTPEVNIL